MRWAKVPDWLVAALVAVPRAQRCAQPGNAVLTFAVLGYTFADWRTHEAVASQQELAQATGLSRSNVGRCIETLEHVRALDVTAGRDGWRGRSRFVLASDGPLPMGGHLDASLPTHGREWPTRGHLRVVETAGQDPSRCPPMGRTTQRSESSPEEIASQEDDVWSLLGPQPFPGFEKAAMPAWLRDGGVRAAVREVRAACADPGRGARLPDVGAADGSDARSGASWAGDASPGTEGGR